MSLVASQSAATHDRSTLSEVASPSDRRESLFERLEAVVVLAGTIRPGALRKSTGRSRLELPVDAQRTVLDSWGQALDEMAQTWPIERVPVRVIVDHGCTVARGRHARERIDLHVEQDPSELRGPGGLLRDVAQQYGPDRYILVIRASHLPIDSLAGQVEALTARDADLNMLCSPEGTPNGPMLIRCGCLAAINSVGFVDLNEQGLPMIARDHDVRVVRYRGQFTDSLRTRGGYLSALADFHRNRSGQPIIQSPFAEQLEPSFSILEPGAVVDDSAVIHDSVVLGGGRVEAGAVVVRSVVCPGSVIRSGQTVVDRLVGGRGDTGQDRAR